MPHVSGKNIPQSTKKRVKKLVDSYLKNTSVNKRAKIYSEVFTETEKIMIGKRFLLVYLVSQKMPTLTICDTLKVSPSTVARFEQRVENGFFKHTVSWLKYDKVESYILKLLGDLFMIPFEDRGKPMNLGKYLDEKL